VHAVRAELTWDEIEVVYHDPNVEYIEHNRQGSIAGEIETYGIKAVQGDENDIPDYSGPSSCSNPNSIKVAIIDIGLDRSHPDIACTTSNCNGEIFGATSVAWYEAPGTHGTNVAGVIAATRNNKIGIKGVADGRDICWLIGRIGDADEDKFQESTMHDATQWAVDQGANVINLSLTLPTASETGRNLFQKIWQEDGVFVAAAAGNFGAQDPEYPASYEGVVSVAAVDENNERASFSQFNEFVDLAAPGVAVLTTARLNTQANLLLVANVGSVGAEAMYAESSVVKTAQGQLVECRDFGQSVCSGPGNHVCLIQE
jgi:serine protease